MGNRTLKAPGVEIIEHDLSSYTTTNLGTNCLITGFAQKGEDLEPIQITNKAAWLLNFGAPTNEAEEYFYSAGMEVLNQGGFLYAAKIPYSNDIAGIYAAAKYKIGSARGLYSYDEIGLYDEKDDDPLTGEHNYVQDGEEVLEMDSPEGILSRNYRGLKSLGINSLSLIAPAAQDFLSKDTVEEYETGESEPASDVIYLVDRTRAVYSRAVEVADSQENRDARACIGIVPVITTLCNTAWFQRKTTGVEADVDELYQPVRSLKTIEFPSGAASAAEYKPTKFQDSDLHTKLLKQDGSFSTSLSETAATIAQSCLVNGNLQDGKLKPFVANDVCIVVFKAFVSTEDGKIDFTPVETWVGSLDPDGRDEKGLTTYIDTIVNNGSKYIYCFSNLSNPKQVLNPDHGFVAGSDSEYDTVKDDLTDDPEYLASTLFSAYAARMLGFGDEVATTETSGLPAPRDYTWETDDSAGSKLYDAAKVSMGALRQFYNQDAKAKCCTLDELAYGGSVTQDQLVALLGGKNGNLLKEANLNPFHMVLSDKFINEEPTVRYTIVKGSTKSGSEKDPVYGGIDFGLSRADGVAEDDFDIESYDYSLEIGKENDKKDYLTQGAIANAKLDQSRLSELTILNSTDYLRAIQQFDDLAGEDLATAFGLNPDEETGSYYDTVQGANARCQAIQWLIVNSLEKYSTFKAKLRYVKKARINLDRLDLNFNWSRTSEDASKKKIGQKYVEDVYTAYDSTGVLAGITFVDDEAAKPSSSSGSGASTLLKTKDALEAKLDSIVNLDTTKSEKMKPRQSTKSDSADTVYIRKYLRLRAYLLSTYYAKLAGLLTTVSKVLDDCAYAQDRYVEKMRNLDDSNIMLGFYPEMAEPVISYSTIAQSLNKIFDEMGNVDTSEIDVVCDAGVSNIAQFVKQVYDPSADDGEDVGGVYQPVKYSSYFKFSKNTDLSYWKTIVYKFDTFCKYRGDCMFCTEGPRGMVLTGNKQVVRKTKKDTSVDLNILPYLSMITGFNTSYGAGYLNWYKTVSDYTGDILWLPPSIQAMGTYILTDKCYNWWDAPAGMKRGVLSVVDTAFNPNKTQAGEIYDVNWNFAINYVNDGVIQEGQKTFQTRQSALDRVNVRRLVGRIKRYVYQASKPFLYEAHTAALRNKYVATLNPFFEDLAVRGGLYDYKIICDETNNTAEVIDRNELRVKIGIKPVKTIEWIIVDLCVLNTGASWSEMDSI